MPFSTILLTFALALVLLVALGLLTSLVTLAFLGLGSLFSRVFELTLFEATTVTLLGAVVLGLLLRMARTLISGVQGEEYEDWEAEDEEDLYDEDWEEDLDEENVFVGVGRNDPCPCGSGRKFKYCHGRGGGR